MTPKFLGGLEDAMRILGDMMNDDSVPMTFRLRAAAVVLGLGEEANRILGRTPDAPDAAGTKGQDA